MFRARTHIASFPMAVGVAAVLLAVPPGRPLCAQEKVDVQTIEKIKSEEMSNSHVMDIMSWLSDVYGPRLTWSPNIMRARDWAMGEMRTWGLANVHAETWDTPAGLGWQNERFSLMALTPAPFIVEAVPQAWSVGTNGPVKGEAMRVTAGCLAELKQEYAGKLRGAFVMPSEPVNKPVNAFVATATRLSDSTLSAMESAQPPVAAGPPAARREPEMSAACHAEYARDSVDAAKRGLVLRVLRPGLNIADTSALRWMSAQGVAAILLGDASHVGGDIGTNNGASRVSGVAAIPTVHVSQESYGRIARMLEKHVAVPLQLDMKNTFFPQNKTSFNIIGEIPGTDPSLAHEVVMIGAHFDSWHSGTGATDNGAGSGVMLEAIRLLKTLGLKPRRTIRIALWTGEEQGLLGSRAYVKQHFGYRDSTGVHLTQEQKDFAAYFNVDNGSGKIRGVYLQGMAAERPIFDAWMGPFKDMGMKTLTISNTGGTDHLSYVAVGLPGFQFIQDPLDYGNVTHHTNQDVYERLQPDDMKFNAAVVASFAWQAAERDEKLPRPPQP
ncbi:MAG TPA: M20/M25/M40 family metallo-hydrolase [Gemmatimonadaceae bacterium]|nr:M20/M25/M40 family metallo-hydrolase [Gemmatimonadaceae bacterium]